MHHPSSHLSEWTLEQLAEETLSSAERAEATAHLESCAHCAAELEGYRALAAALSGLPRFAPSPGFADAVMARVRVAPAPNPLAAWIGQWLPTTTRGWVLLAGAVVAPALPVLALVIYVLSRPMVSARSLGQMALLQVEGWVNSVTATVLHWGWVSNLAGTFHGAYGAVAGTPDHALWLVLAATAVGVPL
ncbi:MAG TPA: hypothetical protein VFI96_07935, partial [Longimicrobiaceae bacterium]|nr:hypothetical protein [Longimicrobiaceae bacterium]